MATEKQIEANRSNAKKSTGPRTEQGKAHSRANAWKHGLTAKTLLIVGEYAEDFEELRSALIIEFGPQTTMETEQVERLAVISWRLRRVPHFEASIVATRQAHVLDTYGPDYFPEGGSDEEHRARFIGESLIFDGCFHDVRGKLDRHEAAQMKAFAKTMEMLDELQRNRSSRSSRCEVVVRLKPVEDAA